MEAPKVEPVDLLGDGDLGVVDVHPGSAVADELGFEQAVERLGECVDAPIAVKPANAKPQVKGPLHRIAAGHGTAVG